MENDDMKKCPYCAELIKKEAIKCRYCGSMLSKREFNIDFLSTPGYWHRINEGKKVAGVCTGIARQLNSPILILPLRIFFILTSIFYAFGVILYILLWILMPAPIDKLGGGGKTTGEETKQTVGEDVSTSTNREEKEESNSSETKEKNNIEMKRILFDISLVTVGILVFFCIYTFVLEYMLGIPLVTGSLIYRFIIICSLMISIFFALYYKNIHSSFIKTNSSGIV